ncbi:hypothetical protein GCM10027275_15270 [Rhabdobacter roseus]|uniref:Glycosyltransferase involved in cell wall biosynthesis n=1 Tax=Rhabdobacter roseus TaxID=1655419 RepID=A0A840TNW8_9BACT|nr:glycosyltransferase [Rhabdobacter roseus]MBB5283447.1 glycosyltransferase involved in cell wall biosynthesis [Rhabdobacter roseus]
MLSIIIASANADDLAQVQENIERTIGVPYEVIAFANPNGEKGICEIYNAGARQARYEVLCFMHEDLEFRTPNWGRKVLEIFAQNSQVGVVGVAGGGYKALAPMGWYCLEFHSDDRSYQNVIQGYKHQRLPDVHAYHNPHREVLSEVPCVDGLWFCTRRELALKYPFDAQLLRYFHGYDLDYCLSVFILAKYRIVVTYDILIRHASEGTFDKKWQDEILKLHKKWSKYLPATTSEIPERERYFIEKRAFKNKIEEMLDGGYLFGEVQRMLINSLPSERMSPRFFLKMYWYLVKQAWQRRHVALPK